MTRTEFVRKNLRKWRFYCRNQNCCALCTQLENFGVAVSRYELQWTTSAC